MFGLEWRHGTTRSVLLTTRYAIKFPTLRTWPLFLRGLLANMQEATFGRLGWLHVAPVLAAVPGGACVVMPRARTLHAPLPAGTYRALVTQPTHTIPAENKPCSWGYLPDGSLVAVDYG